MTEKLAEIQAEVKYSKIIKIQNNIQNNGNITSAGSKDKCQVDINQTYDVPKRFVGLDKQKGTLSSRFWLE